MRRNYCWVAILAICTILPIWRNVLAREQSSLDYVTGQIRTDKDASSSRQNREAAPRAKEIRVSDPPGQESLPSRGTRERRWEHEVEDSRKHSESSKLPYGEFQSSPTAAENGKTIEGPLAEHLRERSREANRSETLKTGKSAVDYSGLYIKEGEGGADKDDTFHRTLNDDSEIQDGALENQRNTDLRFGKSRRLRIEGKRAKERTQNSREYHRRLDLEAIDEIRLVHRSSNRSKDAPLKEESKTAKNLTEAILDRRNKDVSSTKDGHKTSKPERSRVDHDNAYLEGSDEPRKGSAEKQASTPRDEIKDSPSAEHEITSGTILSTEVSTQESILEHLALPGQRSFVKRLSPRYDDRIKSARTEGLVDAPFHPDDRSDKLEARGDEKVGDNIEPADKWRSPFRESRILNSSLQFSDPLSSWILRGTIKDSSGRRNGVTDRALPRVGGHKSETPVPRLAYPRRKYGESLAIGGGAVDGAGGSYLRGDAQRSQEQRGTDNPEDRYSASYSRLQGEKERSTEGGSLTWAKDLVTSPVNTEKSTTTSEQGSLRDHLDSSLNSQIPKEYRTRRWNAQEASEKCLPIVDRSHDARSFQPDSAALPAKYSPSKQTGELAINLGTSEKSRLRRAARSTSEPLRSGDSSEKEPSVKAPRIYERQEHDELPDYSPSPTSTVSGYTREGAGALAKGHQGGLPEESLDEAWWQSDIKGKHNKARGMEFGVGLRAEGGGESIYNVINVGSRAPGGSPPLAAPRSSTRVETPVYPKSGGKSAPERIYYARPLRSSGEAPGWSGAFKRPASFGGRLENHKQREPINPAGSSGNIRRAGSTVHKSGEVHSTGGAYRLVGIGAIRRLRRAIDGNIEDSGERSTALSEESSIWENRSREEKADNGELASGGGSRNTVVMEETSTRSFSGDTSRSRINGDAERNPDGLIEEPFNRGAEAQRIPEVRAFDRIPGEDGGTLNAGEERRMATYETSNRSSSDGASTMAINRDTKLDPEGIRRSTNASHNHIRSIAIDEDSERKPGLTIREPSRGRDTLKTRSLDRVYLKVQRKPGFKRDTDTLTTKLITKLNRDRILFNKTTSIINSQANLSEPLDESAMESFQEELLESPFIIKHRGFSSVDSTSSVTPIPKGTEPEILTSSRKPDANFPIPPGTSAFSQDAGDRSTDLEMETLGPNDVELRRLSGGKYVGPGEKSGIDKDPGRNPRGSSSAGKQTGDGAVDSASALVSSSSKAGEQKVSGWKSISLREMSNVSREQRIGELENREGGSDNEKEERFQDEEAKVPANIPNGPAITSKTWSNDRLNLEERVDIEESPRSMPAKVSWNDSVEISRASWPDESRRSRQYSSFNLENVIEGREAEKSNESPMQVPMISQENFPGASRAPCFDSLIRDKDGTRLAGKENGTDRSANEFPSKKPGTKALADWRREQRPNETASKGAGPKAKRTKGRERRRFEKPTDVEAREASSLLVGTRLEEYGQKESRFGSSTKDPWYFTSQPDSTWPGEYLARGTTVAAARMDVGQSGEMRATSRDVPSSSEVALEESSGTTRSWLEGNFEPPLEVTTSFSYWASTTIKTNGTKNTNDARKGNEMSDVNTMKQPDNISGSTVTDETNRNDYTSNTNDIKEEQKNTSIDMDETNEVKRVNKASRMEESEKQNKTAEPLERYNNNETKDTDRFNETDKNIQTTEGLISSNIGKIKEAIQMEEMTRAMEIDPDSRNFPITEGTVFTSSTGHFDPSITSPRVDLVSESASSEQTFQELGTPAEILEDVSGKTVDNSSHELEPLNQWPVKHSAVVEGDLVLGGLMMVHEREDTITCGPVMPQGGVQALEAMLYTLDTFNDRGIIPGVKIGAHILDDCDKDTYGLEMAVDFIKGTYPLFFPSSRAFRWGSALCHREKGALDALF
ncbi:hypothetical protein KM043_016453 [Ampulex compressa]|nr:hypothetical protein KM043_016453 [Ampulex compressa]